MLPTTQVLNMLCPLIPKNAMKRTLVIPNHRGDN